MSSKLLVLLLYTLSLKNPSRKNSGGVGSGDRGGQILARQYDHRRRSARKVLLFKQYGNSPRLTKTSSPFHFFPTNQWTERNIWITFLR
jgi:hypothetical protein